MHRLTPPALARACALHPWRTITAWILVLVAAVAAIAILLPGSLSTEATTTHEPESWQGYNLISEHFDRSAEPTEMIVVRSTSHGVGDLEFQLMTGEVIDAVREAGGTIPKQPAAALKALQADPQNQTPSPLVTPDRDALLVPVRIGDKRAERVATNLVERLDRLDGRDAISVDVTGQWVGANDLNTLSQRDLKHGELYFGLPIALIVLLLVFCTVVGALLPLLLALVAIVVAVGISAIVGQGIELSVFIVNMISGMGLALGIDYSLFVLSRYREERARGEEHGAAISITGQTASRAVLFSGLIFVVALLGMLFVPTTIMRSLALGAIFVGVAAVAAALTLLPALLGLLGDKVDALPLPGRLRRPVRPDSESGIWAGIVRAVMRRPLLSAVLSAALLLAMAAPLTDLRTGAAGVSTLPKDMPSRQGFEALREAFPGAATSPARVVVAADDVRSNEIGHAVDDLGHAVGRDRRFGIAHLRTSEDGKATVLDIPVGADALDPSAVGAVRALREDFVPEYFDDVDGVRVLVTGETAFNIDYFDATSYWTLPVFGFVLGLSFLLLTIVFRSIVVPLKAILLNLLSVGAAYGLLVLVFVHGYGADLLGLRQVEVIDAWVPLFLFSVLFGLSMDYHMFLLTRIRERWSRTGDTTDSVVWAVSSTGPMVTGAALIIVAVFTGFARGDLAMFQQMGFGVAVALLIDATLVRGVLLPASMALLGERNWYLPRRMRWLPELQLEREPERRETPATEA